MGSPNGGIIGVVNPTSFGKCTVKTKTATCSSVPLQPGTTIIKSAIIAGAGGAGAGGAAGGGGGAGGLELSYFQFVEHTIPITIGAGGAGGK
jgi:hypothetical protein